MGDPAKRRATYEDLLAVPDHVVAELINGALVTNPRPAARHARASSSLGGELYGPFDRGRGGPGGWILLDEPELSSIPLPEHSKLVASRMVAGRCWECGVMTRACASSLSQRSTSSSPDSGPGSRSPLRPELGPAVGDRT